MPEAPRRFAGDRLSLDEYLADYHARFWRTGPSGCWKLERRQTFREPGNASWAASARGDWDRAIELLHHARDNVREFQRKILDHGFEFRRLRIVEKPYSPYLIWELNSILIRHEYGERIRVLPSAQVSALESGGVLPEILVLGGEVVYEVVYDDSGTATGAVRATRPDTVRSWAEFIRGLFGRGENLADFFAREIAGLRPAHA